MLNRQQLSALANAFYDRGTRALPGPDGALEVRPNVISLLIEAYVRDGVARVDEVAGRPQISLRLERQDVHAQVLQRVSEVLEASVRQTHKSGPSMFLVSHPNEALRGGRPQAPVRLGAGYSSSNLPFVQAEPIKASSICKSIGE